MSILFINKKVLTMNQQNEPTTDTVFIGSNNIPEELMQKRQIRPKENLINGLTGIINTGNTCYMNSAVQAFSHNYPLTNYLFTHENEILETLKKNARKIFMGSSAYDPKSLTSKIPLELRMKIQDDHYDPASLTDDECNLIYNSTITAQLIKLLKNMWVRNCVVIPSSFKRVFLEARDKFFFGYEQHDAEEAYSCILQKMQEELAEKQRVKFKSLKSSVEEFYDFKNNIASRIKNANHHDEKKKLYEEFKQKKKEMPMESLTIEAFREMKKYYDSCYSTITFIFCGFLHSSTNCPNPACGYSSNKFDPFLLLCLPMPPRHEHKINLAIDDCIHEYFKEERLDDNNLWLCEGCNHNVGAIKRLQLWTAPPVLVIQLKRFGADRFNAARNNKDSRFIKYPMEHFDISSIISPGNLDKNKCYTYRLQCVVNHTGGLSGGHYYSYCLDEDSDQWFRFDDEKVSLINKSVIVTNAAYLLYYMCEDMIIKPTINIQN